VLPAGPCRAYPGEGEHVLAWLVPFGPHLEVLMSTTTRIHLACVLGLTVTAGLAFAAVGPLPPTSAPEPAYRVSGPFTHENLTIFLLHGEDQVKGKKFLTLDEALEAKKVIVHETKNVNQLSIENVSSEEVFVQAGDIVKGGQQDRTIAIDTIVPPRSGKLPLNSFCVEQGRWHKRGGENEKAFDSSKAALVGNPLKLAARGAGSQRQVWNNVTYAQKKLMDNLKADVRGKASATSLQLTLENKKLLETVKGYVAKLEKSLDKQSDVVGYAVAINGKVNNADVYANADLFRKLWPKLLTCTAIEAVAEQKPGAKTAPVTTTAVQTFLADVRKGKLSEKKVHKDIRELKKETDKNVLFETQCNNTVIRRSYLAK
jgi:hypothetical protein